MRGRYVFRDDEGSFREVKRTPAMGGLSLLIIVQYGLSDFSTTDKPVLA